MTPDQPSGGRRHLAEQASKEMDRIQSLRSDSPRSNTIDPKKLTELVTKLNGLLDNAFQA